MEPHLSNYRSFRDFATPTYGFSSKPSQGTDPEERELELLESTVTYTWPDSNENILFRYKGEYSGTKRHGKGMLTSPQGDQYVGEFNNDDITGKGTYTWKNGNKYEGDFVNGKSHGVGTITCKEYKYKGDFFNGKRHGEGTITREFGFPYKTRFKNDIEEGRL